MGAVGLVYAPLAPLVSLAAAAVFWLSALVYKYQIMFVFVSKVESGGVGLGSSVATLFSYRCSASGTSLSIVCWFLWF